MNVVVGLILVFAVLVLLLLFLNRSSRSFLDSLTCDEGAGTGLVQVSKAEGCQAEKNQEDYYLGFFGRKEGHVCCEITNYDPNDPKTWPVVPGTGPNAGVAVQQLTMTSALTSKTLADGATVPVYASNTATGNAKSPNKIDIAGSISCPKGDSCNDITCEETLTTTTGKDLTKEPNLLKTRLCAGSTIKSPTSNPPNTKGILGSLEIIPDPAYADQTLLYTLRIKKGDAELETYTLKFRITSPVKYAGLTPTWSRRKEVTAACESPIACSDILFKTVDKPAPNTVPTCSFDDINPNTAVELRTTYCIVKDGNLEPGSCDLTLNACTQRLLAMNDAAYSGVHAALLTAVDRGIIQDSFALQFATTQGEKSTYSCIKNTGTITGSGVTADNGASLYRVPVDPTTGRAMFTLEHKSFEGKYLCLYGRDKTDPNTVYAAKGPVKLALDVTPPTAHLEFKPGSLQLRFGCTDQPDGESVDPDLVSGCKDTFGTAYISQTAPFLAALVSQDTPQNAAAWCPPYANAGGYSFEARPITQYKGNEIRVLCLRVEDNAGNAGVAMTTVYNTYDLLLNALAGAVNEGR